MAIIVNLLDFLIDDDDDKNILIDDDDDEHKVKYYILFGYDEFKDT